MTKPEQLRDRTNRKNLTQHNHQSQSGPIAQNTKYVQQKTRIR